MAQPQEHAIESIENAVAHLADALAHLERLPASAGSTPALVGQAMNNYLSVTDATLDLLSLAIQGHPDPEVVRWIEGLRHLGTLMRHAAGRLFETSTTPAPPLRFEAFDLGRLVRRTCEYYRRAAARKDLDVLFRAGPDLPHAWADRVAVAVIVDNLLSNAVNLSTRGGRIIAETLANPGGLVCRVSGTGSALNPIDQRPPSETDAKRSPAPAVGDSCDGYGLAIVEELVTRMGGRVWIEREPGDASSVSFRIPYSPPGGGSRQSGG